MNKKFSTLVAALFCTAVSLPAAAQTVMPVQNPGTLNVLSIDQTKYYQLASSNGKFVLVMEPTTSAGSEYTLKLKSIETSQVDLDASLWKIDFKTTQAGTTFTYVNKKTGLPLSINSDKAVDFSKVAGTKMTGNTVTMNGAVSNWSWDGRPPFVQQGSTQALGAKGLTSYFVADSVVTLVTGADFDATKDEVVQIPTFNPDGTPTGSYNSQSSNYNYTKSEDVYVVRAHKDAVNWRKVQLRLAPVTPGELNLSAQALNTKFGTDIEGTSFQLSATPELKVGANGNSTLGNIFTKNTYRAWYLQTAQGTDINTFRMNHGVAGLSDRDEDGYVMLQVVDGTTNDKPFEAKWLIADTAYIDGLSVNNQNFVKFADTATVTSTSNATGLYVTGLQKGRDFKSALFKFTYYPMQDSIAIEIKDYKVKNDAVDPLTGSRWTKAGVDKNVILNKLTAANEITLGQAPANIKFILGAGNDNRSTEVNGLFYIKNKDGKYLAVPIDEDGYNNAKWVTVKANEQNVAHMPAYQWVVLKNNEAATLSGTSSLQIANREFADVNVSTVQLYQKQGASYKYAATNVLFATSDSVVFEQITDATILGDTLLGYMNKNANELKVMNFKFNYLHPYATDKYIGKNAEDSLLSVLDEQTPFYLEGKGIADYGYKVTSTVASKIAGLKQLRREAYIPYVKTAEGKIYMDVNNANQYFLAKTVTANAFYFKENNQYQPEGNTTAQCYYAMIHLDHPSNDSTKVGTTDDDMSAILKNQVLNETRTSAFAVVPNDAPLYRRFNTELEGAVEG